MAIDYKPVVTQSLAKQIAENLRNAILSGQLQVDERLPTEEELAQQFQVSRPTIREALKRLAAQNLIRSRRGPSGGTFVNRPSLQEASESLTMSATLLAGIDAFSLTEIAEARHELELLCCRYAAQRRQQAQLDVMAEELTQQQASTLSDEAFCASDVRFHRALVDASQNAVLRYLMHAVIEAMQPVVNMVAFRFRDRELIVQQHRRIYTALQAQDADAACAALDEQMHYLKEQYALAQAWRAQRGR